MGHTESGFLLPLIKTGFSECFAALNAIVPVGARQLALIFVSYRINVSHKYKHQPNTMTFQEMP